jgi:Tfp pilus assembly protein PilN
MSVNNNEKFDRVFKEALDLLEKGKPASEILDLFPEFKNELKDLFQTIEVINEQKEKIAPPQELLEKILSRLPFENVTDEKDSRYLYRGEIKGRPSMFQSINIIEWLSMNRKIYIGIGVVVLAVAVGIGIFWQSQKVAVSPEGQKLAYETKSLSEDISELETLGEETDLENLEQDLSAIAEVEGVEGSPAASEKPAEPEAPAVDVSNLESLEDELEAELDGFATDLADLSGFEGDTSLDNLDSGLSGVAE